jgi:ankyrin repeat protein
MDMKINLSLGAWMTIVFVLATLFIASTIVATNTIQYSAHANKVDETSVYIAKSAMENTLYNNATTPLHSAAMEGKIKVVEKLIAIGQNINARDANGTTPLHGAALEGQLETAELLLQNGAEVNLQDKNGNTPLFMASFNKHEAMMAVLKSHGGQY